MREFWFVLKEQFDYASIMWRLSAYERSARYQNHALGSFWLVINPLMQVITYWLVFGIGFSQRSNVEGVPYVPWLIAGLAVWLFINTSFMDTTTSIATQVTQVMRMKFPVSILPMMRVLMNVNSFIVMFLIGIGMSVFTGLPITVYWLQVFYYLFAITAFLYVFGILNATITVLFFDYQQVLQTIMRFVFWTSGALWNLEVMIGDRFPKLMAIFELNPFYYLVNGMRDAFFGNTWFWENTTPTLFFWALVLLVGIVGAHLHLKFRSHFADLV